ncbi:MAG: DUF2256 domain-containing protein [Paracoccaceae bacterium]
MIYQLWACQPLFINLVDDLVKKSDLPQKICPTCNRPFYWRKKWQANWKTVKYCSRRCRSEK